MLTPRPTEGDVVRRLQHLLSETEAPAPRSTPLAHAHDLTCVELAHVMERTRTGLHGLAGGGTVGHARQTQGHQIAVLGHLLGHPLLDPADERMLWAQIEVALALSIEPLQQGGIEALVAASGLPEGPTQRRALDLLWALELPALPRGAAIQLLDISALYDQPEWAARVADLAGDIPLWARTAFAHLEPAHQQHILERAGQWDRDDATGLLWTLRQLPPGTVPASWLAALALHADPAVRLEVQETWRHCRAEVARPDPPSARRR